MEIQERLPSTMDGRLRFLLAFAHQIPGRLGERDLRFMDHLVHAIALGAFVGGQKRQIEFSGSPLDGAMIVEMQRQMGECLRAMIAGDHWTLPGAPSGVWLSRIGSKGKSRILKTVIGAFPYTFWDTIAGWLEVGGNRLRACAECRTPFVATKRQVYCSKKCSQRVRQRRWNEQHREKISEKQHERYKRRIKRIYPRAKIQRRKRVAVVLNTPTHKEDAR